MTKIMSFFINKGNKQKKCITIIGKNREIKKGVVTKRETALKTISQKRALTSLSKYFVGAKGLYCSEKEIMSLRNV